MDLQLLYLSAFDAKPQQTHADVERTDRPILPATDMAIELAPAVRMALRYGSHYHDHCTTGLYNGAVEAVRTIKVSPDGDMLITYEYTYFGWNMTAWYRAKVN